MASKPSHPRLAEHNARVLRLARDYDKKYRPVLIPVAKHVNLETGDSFPRIQLIMSESARYTGNRKPLSRASVFRLLAEMADAGAIKTEPGSGQPAASGRPTGTSTSTWPSDSASRWSTSGTLPWPRMRPRVRPLVRPRMRPL